MKQYLITAKDFTDENALERRLKARPLHFENARRLKLTGNFISGGAVLDEHDKMIGSMMVLQFDSESEVDKWKESEPYLTMKVWENIDIRPFKLADV
ncbi:hypothetical protein GS399_14405 [Pedobacter sp. HMF7647]|uniref:YCII-related domain-containing protein n=1 Tax=Hufsiella arboris TaxID=2695275 RepID=A0A7K1YC52_9SPHI|nr:YciI family protein [Hufsiella arboris]MXV52166.1 hypothetical protein [Hufsiella arboris]